MVAAFGREVDDVNQALHDLAPSTPFTANELRALLLGCVHTTVPEPELAHVGLAARTLPGTTTRTVRLASQQPVGLARQLRDLQARLVAAAKPLELSETEALRLFVGGIIEPERASRDALRAAGLETMTHGTACRARLQRRAVSIPLRVSR